jgi:DNA-binding Xre family transcriptional regulator
MATRFRLREVLEEAQMTQTEAAELAGLGLATVNRMCRFPGRSQTLEILDRLSAVLHIEPGDLVTRAPVPGAKIRTRGRGRPPLEHPRAPVGPRRVGSRTRRRWAQTEYDDAARPPLGLPQEWAEDGPEGGAGA